MKTIIVGHQAGEAARRVLERAIRIAVQEDAALRIVHVVPNLPAGAEYPPPHRRILSDARTLAEELAGGSVTISATMTGGDPAEQIAREVERAGADLAIIGAHGDPRFRDALFGTTVMRLARSCSRPVLVVQNGDVHAYRTAMLAIDHICTAGSALALAGLLAPAAELFAVHAFRSSLVQALAGTRGTVQGDLELELDALAQRHLPARHVQQVHAIAHEGDAFEVLMRIQSDLKPDLLVMGNRSRHGLSRLLFENMTDAILLAATCDILVVREDEPL